MKTVKQLMSDLAKFPDDAECFAYEGEVVGIVINDDYGGEGLIYCSEFEDTEPTLFI